MGGLVINNNAQVIGFNMKPVKGLYAAGEVTGGVHGAVRLGSVAMADCVVFGRIAGKNAAKEQG
jgi:succinate dehydrogenase/fumarate reductase flavoprotein subunit